MVRKSESREESRVEFLGEQDGAAERDLKAHLTEWLLGDPDVTHAYLAQVGYQPSAPRSVALCLVSTRPGNPTVVNGIGAIFRRLFNSQAHLDILFVSDRQHEDLRRVCSAFYARAT